MRCCESSEATRSDELHRLTLARITDSSWNMPIETFECTAQGSGVLGDTKVRWGRFGTGIHG